MAKGKKVVTEEKVDTIGQSNQATEHDSGRKPFTRPATPVGLFEGKKGLVVSGYSAEPIQGHYPHVTTWRVIRDLGLNPKDYAQCDERHVDVVEQAKGLGLEVITVADYQKRLAELAK